MGIGKILNKIGLKENITCKEPNFYFWDEKDFSRYSESDYLNSETREVDEVYRMSEFILLHKSSGIRMRVIYSESYYGDELDYTICNLFVISKGNKRCEVFDVNFDKELISTEIGDISFKSTSKRII
jgi:hypothetical protein